MKRNHLAIAILATAPSMLAHAAPTTVDDFYTPDAVVFSVAVNDSYVVNAKNFTVAGPGFLANDTGGIGTIQATLIVSGVANGTLTAFPGGNFTYTPNTGPATDDSFTYRIADSLGRTSQATVTLVMTANLPVAVNDKYTVNATTFSVSAPGFLRQ